MSSPLEEAVSRFEQNLRARVDDICHVLIGTKSNPIKTECNINATITTGNENKTKKRFQINFNDAFPADKTTPLQHLLGTDRSSGAPSAPPVLSSLDNREQCKCGHDVRYCKNCSIQGRIRKLTGELARSTDLAVIPQQSIRSKGSRQRSASAEDSSRSPYKNLGSSMSLKEIPHPEREANQNESIESLTGMSFDPMGPINLERKQLSPVGFQSPDEGTLGPASPIRNRRITIDFRRYDGEFKKPLPPEISPILKTKKNTGSQTPNKKHTFDDGLKPLNLSLAYKRSPDEMNYPIDLSPAKRISPEKRLSFYSSTSSDTNYSLDQIYSPDQAVSHSITHHGTHSSPIERPPLNQCWSTESPKNASYQEFFLHDPQNSPRQILSQMTQFESCSPPRSTPGHYVATNESRPQFYPFDSEESPDRGLLPRKHYEMRSSPTKRQYHQDFTADMLQSQIYPHENEQQYFDLNSPEMTRYSEIQSSISKRPSEMNLSLTIESPDKAYLTSGERYTLRTDVPSVKNQTRKESHSTTQKYSELSSPSESQSIETSLSSKSNFSERYVSVIKRIAPRKNIPTQTLSPENRSQTETNAPERKSPKEGNSSEKDISNETINLKKNPATQTNSTEISIPTETISPEKGSTAEAVETTSSKKNSPKKSGPTKTPSPEKKLSNPMGTPSPRATKKKKRGRLPKIKKCIPQ